VIVGSRFNEMMGMESLVFIGAAGGTQNAAAIVDAINDHEKCYSIAGCLDDDPFAGGGVRVLGPIGEAATIKNVKFVLATFASVHKQPRVLELAKILDLPDSDFATLIHPRATLSKHTRVGAGSCVAAGVSISPNATVGKHSFVFQNVVLGSGVTIHDGVAIANSVSVLGPSAISRSCFLGANSTIGPGVELGPGCIVGMGAVVLRSFPANSTIVGNPGRAI